MDKKILVAQMKVRKILFSSRELQEQQQWVGLATWQ